MVASPRLPGTKGTLCHPEGPHHSPQRPPFQQHECRQAVWLLPASPDGVPCRRSLWGHRQQKSQFRFYQIFPNCVFSAKTAKYSDLGNRFLSGVGGRGYCHHPFTDYLPNTCCAPSSGLGAEGKETQTNPAYKSCQPAVSSEKPMSVKEAQKATQTV